MKFKVLLLTFLVWFDIQAQAAIVTHPMTSERVCGRVEMNGLTYLCYDHPRYGKELHVMSGDQYGTRIIKDIDPGRGNSIISGLSVWNNKLFFIAETAQTGPALWTSDGSTSGTVMLKRLPTYGSPSSLKSFSESESLWVGVYNESLVVSNGTESGTFIRSYEQLGISWVYSFSQHNGDVYTSLLENGDYNPIFARIRPDGRLIKLAQTDRLCRPEIFGQFLDKLVLEGWSNCGNLNTIASFAVFDPTTNQLTRPDIFPLNGSSNAQNTEGLIGIVGDRLYFLLRNKDKYEVRYTTDLVTSHLFENVVVSSDSYERIPQEAVLLFENILMIAKGSETLVINLNNSSSLLHPVKLKLSEHYFRSSNGLIFLVDYNKHLYVIDPEDLSLRNLHSFPIRIDSMLAGGGKVYFTNEDRNRLFVTNGILANTFRILLNASGDAKDIVLWTEFTEGGRLFFVTFPEAELWHTDTTQTNTHRLYMRYDDGVPVPPPVYNKGYLPSIFELLLNEITD